MRSWLGTMQRAIGKRSLGTLLAVRLRNQCEAIIANHLSDGPDLEVNGERWLAELLAESASVFVDVGANVGSWATLFLQTMHAPVLGLLIEPGRNAIAALSQRFRDKPAVQLVEAAASDHVGEASFYEEPSAGETSSLISTFAQPGAVERKVAVTTVDAEITRRKIEYVDVLKVDAEGHDFHVIRGAIGALRSHRIGIVQFEYNKPWADVGSTLAGALKLLDGAGYTTYLLKSRGLYALRYSEYGEYYAYSNFVAVAPRKLSQIAPYVRGVI